MKLVNFEYLISEQYIRGECLLSYIFIKIKKVRPIIYILCIRMTKFSLKQYNTRAVEFPEEQKDLFIKFLVPWQALHYSSSMETLLSLGC